MTAPVAIALILGCLVIQGFFSGSEIALVSANRTRLQARADEGSRGASLALGLLEHEERLLGTCLIGTNFALVSGATLMGGLLAEKGLSAEWIATAVFVPLALTFGEALPKTVYSHHADLLAPVLAWPLHGIQKLLAPALAVITRWSRMLEVVTRAPVKSIKREDIVELLDEKSGNIHPDERRLIQRLFALPDVAVGQCMTPLVDVFAVPEDARIGDAIDLVIGGGHSRLPVYRDRVDNIVGVISHRDLLQVTDETATVGGLVRPVPFVPETQPIDRLLRDMRSGNDHFAVVVDEYGGSIGIVTIEDLLEEIVGEIEDELDSEGPEIRRLGEREWRVPARTEIEDLEEELEISLPEGPYETVGGLILTVLGRIPTAGEQVPVGRAEFLVEVANERSIQTLKVTLKEESL